MKRGVLKKILIGTVSVFLILVTILSIAYAYDRQNLISYNYNKINLEHYESEEFRSQYAGGLNKTKGEMEKAYQILSEIQEKCHMAYSPKNLINRIMIELNKHLEYQTGCDTSHADAIINGKGKCYHYAYLFNLLVESFGFETEVLYGKTSNDYHVWNRIRIDGEWFYFDPTWADSNRTKYSWLTEEEMLTEMNVLAWKVVYSTKTGITLATQTKAL